VAEQDRGISCKTHYLVPEPKRAQLAPEEVAFLEAKGAFSTEAPELRELLVSLFFDYVYPLLPVVDPHDFFRRYDGGCKNISPLLLQSMFLAASNVSLSVPQCGRLMMLILGPVPPSRRHQGNFVVVDHLHEESVLPSSQGCTSSHNQWRHP
jgi:hypothetical protein